MCACVCGYVSLFCIGDILQYQPFVWVFIFSRLCQILYSKKKSFLKAFKKKAFLDIPFILIWLGQTDPRRTLLLLFLLHPHKIIELTMIFVIFFTFEK